LICGWVVEAMNCPCGATSRKDMKAAWPLEKGSRVLARPGIGPSMYRWDEGKVVAHEASLHRIETRFAEFWCEPKDLFPLGARPESFAAREQRVWAWCLDGRWYAGAVEARQGPLGYVQWDDGDAMWLDVSQVVHLALEAGPPTIGQIVLAPRWDGDSQYCKVEQLDDGRVEVAFNDGEQAWCDAGEVKTFAPNPFQDA
jgi:hypothetical protein